MSAVVHAPFALFHLRPYAEGGVEYDRFSPTPAAITTAKNQGFAAVSTATINHNNEFGMNLGAGVDRKIMKRVTFRLDLRDHITGSPRFGLPAEPNLSSSATFPVAGHANNIEYTAGIVFHLGKL
jgi:opacity protein-like surface antigen